MARRAWAYWPADEGCDPTVRDAIAVALDVAESAGARLRYEREVAGLDGWSRMLMATVGPEAAVALEPYPREAMPAPLLEILDAGRAQSATDYVVAQRDRAALREALDRALSDVDALALPTSLTVAWRWDEIDDSDMGSGTWPRCGSRPKPVRAPRHLDPGPQRRPAGACS